VCVREVLIKKPNNNCVRDSDISSPKYLSSSSLGRIKESNENKDIA
jgi:hypothetical protein